MKERGKAKRLHDSITTRDYLIGKTTLRAFFPSFRNITPHNIAQHHINMFLLVCIHTGIYKYSSTDWEQGEILGAGNSISPNICQSARPSTHLSFVCLFIFLPFFLPINVYLTTHMHECICITSNCSYNKYPTSRREKLKKTRHKLLKKKVNHLNHNRSFSYSQASQIICPATLI